MFSNLTGWHFLIILVVILLLFGAPKLPALARSLGQSMKILKAEVRSDDKPADKSADGVVDTAQAPAADATTTTVKSSDSGTAEPTTKP
ncbi:twin-arginine translocase TatA/TatE family subunit [Rathayibacter sp. YIM 133350]|uniref:twin-arginine translocase TatA/TatE family subunit n=1 Tax=Rathayibacter sp. YIM 133350 TaxID=3131992 RepID=UPI00307E112E